MTVLASGGMAKKRPANLLAVFGGNDIYLHDTLAIQLLSIQPFERYTVSEITEIKYGEVDDIVLTLNRKTDIYWGQPKDKNINDKISKLLQVLNFLYSNNTKEVESIDLSFIDMNKDKVLVKYSAVNEDSNA